jgi:hypothetical protein
MQVPVALASSGDSEQLLRCLRLKGIAAVSVALLPQQQHSAVPQLLGATLNGTTNTSTGGGATATAAVIRRNPLVLPEPAMAHMKPGRVEFNVPPREADSGTAVCTVLHRTFAYCNVYTDQHEACCVCYVVFLHSTGSVVRYEIAVHEVAAKDSVRSCL